MTLHVHPGVVGVVLTMSAAGAACSTTNDIAGVGDGPDISIPDISIPDITIPDISIPDITIPDITIPDITIPDITIPDITIPDPSDVTTSDTADWIVFDSPTGDYRITFPGEPALAELPVALPGETLVAEAYVYENAVSAFLTSAFDYPQAFADTDPDVVLTGARDGAIDTLDGVLGSSTDIAVDGVPGIEFTFELDNAGQPGVGSAVMFFEGPRLYQSFALGVPGGAAQYDVFVDTFEFTGAGS